MEQAAAVVFHVIGRPALLTRHRATLDSCFHVQQEASGSFYSSVYTLLHVFRQVVMTPPGVG